jgi:hypothetical protein
MRDMRSAPNTACGFRLETDASCSPDSSSINVDTTLVVPTSTAMPKRIAAVSPGSTASTRRPHVVTVTSPPRSRSACGRPRTTSVGTSSTVRLVTRRSSSRSEIW